MAEVKTALICPQSFTGLATSVRKFTRRMPAVVVLGCLAAACAPTSGRRPTDVGNMAYPAPVPQGNVAATTTTRQAPDTGNMAYPAPVPQGNVATTTTTTRQAPDTGNMAYPAPQPQGNVSTTRVR